MTHTKRKWSFEEERGGGEEEDLALLCVLRPQPVRGKG